VSSNDVRREVECSDLSVRAKPSDSSANSVAREIAASMPEVERASIAPATPNRKRGKQLSRRSGQAGAVVRKGNIWHGRYYVDVPGQEERRRVSVPLCPTNSMTKPEARRKLQAALEQAGVNSEASFIRSTQHPLRTFAQEAEWWKQNRLSLFKPSCQETMGQHVDKYLLPRFGDGAVATIDERQVQEFIADLNRHTKLKPKSIRNVVGVLKLILGEKVWRDWNLALPDVPFREQRYFTEDEMRAIIAEAKGQWKVLFATFAGTGLRAGEVFGLHVDDLELEHGRLRVRRSVWKGQDVSVKTKNGYRVVHIDPALVEMLRQHLDSRTAGRIFQTSRGTPFSKDNVRRKLQTILKKLGLERGGLHAFRHGRVSVLQENGVPGDLVKEWIGHSSLRTTSRYTHFKDDYRQQIAGKLGLLSLSVGSNYGPNGPKSSDVEVKKNVA
jgi:integrase